MVYIDTVLDGILKNELDRFTYLEEGVDIFDEGKHLLRNFNGDTIYTQQPKIIVWNSSI